MLTKLRVLCAHSDARLRNEMSSYFVDKEEFEIFEFAYDGVQLRLKTEQNSYHIIIMDLALEKMKWLETLQWLNEHHTDLYIIAMSELTSDRILTAVQEYNVKYFFLTPFNMDELYEQLLAYYNYGSFPKMRQSTAAESDEELRERICKLVKQADIDPNSKGYEYIVEAVWQIHQKRELVNAVTKQLYPSVANRFGVTNTKVERAIRHAIEVAWQKNGFKNMYTPFEPNTLHQYDKTSNAEFIALLSDKLILGQSSSQSMYASNMNESSGIIH